jgi:hypothetical protein
MKKLGITLLAAAFSLPLTFAATQDAQSTPPAEQGQTSKPAKKKTAKKKHVKKDKGAPTTTETPATK